MENLSPQEQLQKLEEEYRERKAALEQEAEHPAETGQESHEAMSQVLQQHIQSQVPSFEASSHAPRTTTDTLPPEEAAKVQQWINVAFHQGIIQSIQEAKKSGDNALIDAFHGALAGQLYETLIERKKLEAVS